jgi:hypothetical protein
MQQNSVKSSAQHSVLGTATATRVFIGGGDEFGLAEWMEVARTTRPEGIRRIPPNSKSKLRACSRPIESLLAQLNVQRDPSS